LRVQLEALNAVTFTDDEWPRLLAEYVVGANDGAVQKKVRVQEDHVYAFRRDEGSTKNIALIDKKSIHNNRFRTSRVRLDTVLFSSVRRTKYPK
jgi:type I restriction enzyme R subunit